MENQTETSKEQETAEESILPRPMLPENCKKTDMYPMMQQLNIALQELKSVPDLKSGGKRARRYGIFLSMSLIPQLDRIGDGPVLVPTPPAALFDADSLEELRERVIFELDYMIDLTKAALERREKEGPKRFSLLKNDPDNGLMKAK